MIGFMQPFASSLAATLGVLLTALVPVTANAARKQAQSTANTAPQELGHANNWTAYTFTEKGAKVCYIIGKPIKSEPTNVNRGRIDVIITHRPSEHAVNVVNFDVGYPFKEGSDAELDVDGREFTLFTDKESAWTPDAATDKTVTEALMKGNRAVLKGTSQRGTDTTDTYSLDGVTQVLTLADKACDVTR